MLINGKEEEISLVIPYVDNKDETWKEIYIDFCEKNNLREKIENIKCERYEDIGLINYQLKLINKYMPFINKIYLLLMCETQKPKDLPKNVEIVYHAKFIPQRFLPTFNSTTIEMFLWNIPNLSEYFIYANDDMLPFRELKASDFFTESGKCKIEWWNEDLSELTNMFRLQCFNGYRDMAIMLNKKREKYKYMRPAHSFTPLIKSHCKNAFDTLEPYIIKHIRAFRTQYQYNQYIYPIFELFLYGTCDSEIDFLYTQCENGIDLDHDIVCLNKIPKCLENDIICELEKRSFI